MNNVQLIGNLTRDPDIGKTSSGVSYCKFSIAVSRSYSDSDGNREADFFNCIIWRERAESLGKYLAKGDKVGIIGSLQTRTYDAEDGTKRYATDIVVSALDFLTTKAQKEARMPTPPPERTVKNNADELVPSTSDTGNDGLPF